MKIPIISAVLLTVAVAAHATDDCNGLKVDDAWVREPPPPGKVAAGFMRISNRTTHQIHIEAIDSDCCAHTMVHRTVREGEQTHMEHLDVLTVPAGGTTTLEPGGLHLMLMGAKAPLAAGQSVNLRFSCGEDHYAFAAAVKREP